MPLSPSKMSAGWNNDLYNSRKNKPEDEYEWIALEKGSFSFLKSDYCEPIYRWVPSSQRYRDRF